MARASEELSEAEYLTALMASEPLDRGEEFRIGLGALAEKRANGPVVEPGEPPQLKAGYVPLAFLDCHHRRARDAQRPGYFLLGEP